MHIAKTMLKIKQSVAHHTFYGLINIFYYLSQEDVIVQLAAKHFFVQYRSDDSMEKAKSVVQDCVTSKLLENKPEDKWVQMVHTAHVQVQQMCFLYTFYNFWSVLSNKFSVEQVLVK